MRHKRDERTDFIKNLERAEKEIASWPQWKQDWAENWSKSFKARNGIDEEEIDTNSKEYKIAKAIETVLIKALGY